MVENDRLISKIEKLVEIFGSNVDTEVLKYAGGLGSDAPAPARLVDKSLSIPEQTKLLSSTRLLLMTRRSNTQLNAVDEIAPCSSAEKKAHEGKPHADLSMRRTIDKSIGDLQQTLTSRKPLDTNGINDIQKNKDQLRQDLDRLDAEIKKAST
jgi:hypothetical protein